MNAQNVCSFVHVIVRTSGLIFTQVALTIVTKNMTTKNSPTSE